MKTVINEFGKEVVVNDSSKKLYSYDNSKREIVYNAEIMEDGVGTGFYTDYVEEGIVSDIKERLQSWNNKVLLLYSSIVGFNSSVNDPDRLIYNKIVKFVEENESKFFTDDGNFRENFLVSDEEIKNLCK